MVQFVVKDTGIGIKFNEIKELFTLYGKLKHSNPNINSSGCGLGLTISQSLADRLGHKIKVESQHGKGSTFSFSVYLNVDHSTNDIEASGLIDKKNYLYSHKTSIQENIIEIHDINIVKKMPQFRREETKKLQKVISFI